MAKSKTTKTEKIPASVQKYLPIAQSQIQYAMRSNNSDEENIKQLQQELDDYKNMQALQSEFNAWKKQKETPKTEPIKFMTAAERQAYKKKTTIEKPGNYDESKSYANTYGKQTVGVQQIPTLDNYLDKFKDVKHEDLDQTKAEQENRAALAEQAKAYLDPNRKLTKEELEDSKRIVLEGRKSLRGKKPSEMTSYEKEAHDVFADLATKNSSLASLAIGAGKGALTTLQNIGNIVLTANQANAPTSAALDIQRKNIADYRNKVNNVNQSISPTTTAAETQHPVAYNVGKGAEKLSEYMLTNGLFEGVGAAIGGGSKLAAFAGNQLGELSQDLVLDTLPLYMNIVEDPNMTDDEKVNAIVKNISTNAAFNAAAYGVLRFLPDKIATGVRNVLAKQEADKAFRANALQGLDKLQKVNNGVQFGYHNTNPEAVLRNADDVTAATNKQFSDLMSQFNGTFKDDSAMRNIYNPEDLNAALNRQLAEALQNNPRPVVPEVQAPKIPETESIIPEVIQNVPKTEVKPKKVRVEMPAEVADKIGSDLVEIREAAESMRIAAEATNNEAVLKKFDRLRNALDDYENALYYAEDLEELNKAKKATDAARQAFIREMKKIDPNYKGELTGTKIGNAEYRRTSQKLAEDQAQELADSIIESEKELGQNNYVQDAQPDSSNIFKGPDAAKSQQITGDLEIRSTNGKRKRYYVVAKNGDMETPVNPGKTYKTEAEAQNAISNYGLQTFAGGDAPKEQWKTSQFRTNTAENIGKIKNADDVPVKDYGYRVYSEAEQHATAAKNNLSAEDLIYKDQFEASDVKQAMTHFMNLLDAGDIDSLRKANRLGKKIAFETREGGRIPQALAEYNRNTPEGMLREAQQTLNKAVDKKQGKGTSEALDNLFGEISDAYENAANKDEFLKDIQDLLTGDLKEYVPSDVAKKMDSKQIKGADKIIDMINNAQSLDDVPFDEIIDAMYKANGGVPFSAKSQYEIYNLLKEASQYAPKSYERRLIEARAARKVMAEAPSGLGEYIRAFLYDNMLGNFKTAFSRNFLGNVAYQSLEKLREPISAGVDKLVSLKSGKHSMLGWNTGKAAAYGQGFRKGFQEQGKDVLNQVSTARSGENTFADALKNNKTVHNDNTPLGHFANQVDLYVEQAMKFGDRPIFEANYAEYKTELEQMLDRYGKNGVVGLENVKDADLPEVIDKLAAVRAADEVFQKQGKMSEGLTKLRDGLGDISRGAFGVDLLSTASAPFTLTPGNMLERAIEYTPLGFVKNAIESGIELNKGSFNQRRFADEAGRSILGIPVLYGAYKGAQNGLINGGYSTDQDEKAAQYEDGFIEYGLNVGDKTYDTSDLPVYGPFMQAGSVLAENGLSPEAFAQAAEAVAGGSAMQGIRRAFGADSASYSSQNGVVENLANTVKSSGSQLVPSLVRQTAQTMDEYKRDLGEYGTNEYYANLVKNSIPVLRETMPIKTSVEGKPVLQNQGRSLGSKIAENYILPMNVSEYNPSPLNQEASRLLDATDNAGGFAPKSKRSDLRKWDEKTGQEYSEQQFRDYKKDLGQLNSTMGHAFIDSDFYNSMPDQDKVEYLGKAYSAMKAVAKLNATGIDSDDKIANAYLEAGGGDKGIDAAIDYMQQKYVYGKYGVSNSKGAQAVYDDLGEKGIEEFSKFKEALDGSTNSEDIQAVLNKSNLSTSDKAKYYSYLNSDCSPGANPYGYVAGVSYNPDKDKSYQKAKEYLPTVKPVDYYKAKNTIDADNNNSIKQQELVDYMNSIGVSQSDGMNYWSAYGQSTWKKQPQYVNGTWVLPK